MKLSYEDYDAITVLTMSGELTTDQVDAFRRACLDRMACGIRDIVCDMEHMSLVDSAGLELLLWLGEEVAARQGRLRLVGLDDTVRTILRITRLDRRFVVHDTVEAAAKGLR